MRPGGRQHVVEPALRPHDRPPRRLGAAPAGLQQHGHEPYEPRKLDTVAFHLDDVLVVGTVEALGGAGEGEEVARSRAQLDTRDRSRAAPLGGISGEIEQETPLPVARQFGENRGQCGSVAGGPRQRQKVLPSEIRGERTRLRVRRTRPGAVAELSGAGRVVRCRSTEHVRDAGPRHGVGQVLTRAARTQSHESFVRGQGQGPWGGGERCPGVQGQELAHDLGDEASHGDVLDVEPASSARGGGQCGAVVVEGGHDVFDAGAQYLLVDGRRFQVRGVDVVGSRVRQGARSDESPCRLSGVGGADQAEAASRAGTHTVLPSTSCLAGRRLSSSLGDAAVSGVGAVGRP